MTGPSCVLKFKKREVLLHLSREKKDLKSKRESRAKICARDDNSRQALLGTAEAVPLQIKKAAGGSN
jgi:hypothetical protein